MSERGTNIMLVALHLRNPRDNLDDILVELRMFGDIEFFVTDVICLETTLSREALSVALRSRLRDGDRYIIAGGNVTSNVPLRALRGISASPAAPSAEPSA